MNYTSKQEEELCAKGVGYGIRPIFKVGYCFPVEVIRYMLVGAVQMENPFHCNASRGK